MEDFKDVMLSEPPARAAAPTNTSKMSGGYSGGGGNNNTSNVTNSRTLSNQNTTKASGSAGLGGDSTGADFSAYKGILLCDRPVDRTQLGAGSYRASGDMGGPIPFLPSGKSGMIEDRAVGLPPSIESRSRLEQQRTAVRMETKGGTASGALARHKRWLKAFARNVKELTQDQQDAAAKREKVKQAIREKEAQKRQEWFTQPRDTVQGKLLIKTPTPTDSQKSQQNTSSDNNHNNNHYDDHHPTPPNETTGNNTSSFTVSNTRQKPKKNTSQHHHKKAKPVWAMTEEEELDAEFEDARDLIDFASSLDYDSFAKDCEVKEAMAILQQRVKEIAAEKQVDLDYIRQQAQEQADSDDDQFPDDASDAMTTVSVMVQDADGNEYKIHQRKPRRHVRASTKQGDDNQDQNSNTSEKKPEWDANTKQGAAKMLRNAVSQEAFVLAEKLLTENPALRQVHSKYSLSRMLQTVALSGGKTADPSQLSIRDAAMASALKNPFANTAETQGIPFAGRLQPPVVSNVAPEAATNAGNQAVTAVAGAVGSIVDENSGDQQPPAVHRRILVDLRKRKDQTQNLPYLYRHPGI